MTKLEAIEKALAENPVSYTLLLREHGKALIAVAKAAQEFVSLHELPSKSFERLEKALAALAS